MVLALIVFLSHNPFCELLLDAHHFPKAQAGGHLRPPLRQLPKVEHQAEDEGAELVGFFLLKIVPDMAARAPSVLLLVLWHATYVTVCILSKLECHPE